ncbi:hypothetical protein [Nocardioides sp.]|uniref:hypothetical protein n=1 Tax=Nocardioides sp. TaxID=35761 RepID=UPI0035B012FA
MDVPAGRDGAVTGWRDLLGADPLPWLLSSPEPCARWAALTGLTDAGPDEEDVRRAHRDVVADPLTRSLVARLPDWTVDQHLSGHQSPAFAPHLLGLLADMGVAAGDFAEVESLLDAMLEHQEPSGRFASFGTAAPGSAPVWGALLCDTHPVLDVLVRFGRGEDERVRAALARSAADLADTAQGRAWPCVPHPVTGWRGPGRRDAVCPMATLQALRVFSRLRPADWPDGVLDAARVVLRAWAERGSEKPYQFGHGVQFKTVKWPPTWYGALGVVDTVGRFPELWRDDPSGWEAQALAEVTACLLAYNVSADGTVTPRSTYWGFETHSFGQKRLRSPFATAVLLTAVRRVDDLAAAVARVDVRALGSSKGGSGQPVAPRVR